MWNRKSEDEIRQVAAAEEVRRKDVRRPLAYAAGLTAVALLLWSIGYRGGLSQGFVLVSGSPTRFDLRFLLIGVAAFAFFFALTVYHQRRHGGFFNDPHTLLCRDCKESSRGKVGGSCACGGRLEPFDYFDWVPDVEPSQIQPDAETSRSRAPEA